MTSFSLTGKRILVVGIANKSSIAYGCAKAYKDMGASLIVTYLNDKARKHVEPIAAELGAEMLLPLDVSDDAQMKLVFAGLEHAWGGLDGVLHSIAFCPKDDLHGRVVDSSRDGFLNAMDISCHSFVRMANLAEPLMSKGGCMQTVSFYGAEKVVDHYGVMGPVKAALESVTRYMAVDLAPKGIRVNTLSPGPLQTRAASGIDHFDELMAKTQERAPQHQLVTIDDVGAYSAFLMSDAARAITGQLSFIDAGYNIVG